MTNTNYNKMFEEEKTETVEHFEDIVEEVAEKLDVEVDLDPENVQIGKVVDCAKLNVRAEPSLFADLATERPLERNTEVMVYPDESTEDFYKICTESGVEGYCLKKFIVIQ